MFRVFIKQLQSTPVPLCLGLIAAGLLTTVADAQSIRDGFNAPFLGDVQAIAVQPDGGIVISGYESMPGLSGAWGSMRRLHPSGETDPDFVPGKSPWLLPWFEADVRGEMRSLVCLEDGSLLVGGSYFHWLGPAAYGCVKLTPHGVHDRSFTINNPDFADVGAIAVGHDSMIWLSAGQFGLRRFKPNGTNVNAWYVETSAPAWSGTHQGLVALPDGGAVLGGRFETFAGLSRANLVRLLPDGSVDPAFTTGTDRGVRSLARQKDGKILVGGYFSQLGGLARPHLGRLNADGTVDAGFAPSIEFPVHCIKVQPDGRILVAGQSSGIIRLHPDGTQEEGFVANAGEYVYAMELQPDGRILAGGVSLGRFLPDGSREGDFQASDSGELVMSAVMQPDGRLLVAGFLPSSFGSTVGTSALSRRLRGGQPDTAFNVPTNDIVECVGVQADGGIVLGGRFTSVQGTSRQRMARVSQAGVLDASFTPMVNGMVSALALCGDGRWVLGGDFTQVNGQNQIRLARLLPSGAVDGSFGAAADGPVKALSLLSDGRCYVAGAFTQVGGLSQPFLARLGLDGTVDVSYAPTLNGMVKKVCALADGGCLVVGDFTQVQGVPCGGLARLRADGSLDTDFLPEVDFSVRGAFQFGDGQVLVAGGRWSEEDMSWHPDACLLKPDGSRAKILMKHSPDESIYASETIETWIPEADGRFYGAGDFYYSDQSVNVRFCLARWSAPPHTHQRLGLSRSGRVLTWTRLGALARLEHVSFEAAGPDGLWFPLGAGSRIGGTQHWGIGGLTLAPGDWQFRARGMVAGGSGSWHELTSWLTVRSGTPFDDWLEARHGFFAGDSQSAAAWSISAGSGVQNLMSYAVGLAAGLDVPVPLPLLPRAASGGGGMPLVHFPRWPARPDVVLTLQMADDLGGPWFDIARSTSGGVFITLVPGMDLQEGIVDNLPTLTLQEFPASGEPSLPKRRFYRTAVSLVNP